MRQEGGTDKRRPGRDRAMASEAEIGLIGLGVMGQNLALNIAEHGHGVAVYNRTAARTEAFATTDEARRFPVTPCLSLENLIAAVRPPRAIVTLEQQVLCDLAGHAARQADQAGGVLTQRLVIDPGTTVETLDVSDRDELDQVAVALAVPG